MKSRGLINAGYKYFIIDDGVFQKERDASNFLEVRTLRFPLGLDIFIKELKLKKLHVGITQNTGWHTCDTKGAGSFNYVEQDLRYFEKLGIEYLKLTNCNNPLVNAYWAPDIGSLSVGSQRIPVTDAFLTNEARIRDSLVSYIGGG